MSGKLLLLFAAALAFPLACASVDAKDLPAFIPIGPEADAPTGFVEMCQRDLRYCAQTARAGRASATTIPAVDHDGSGQHAVDDASFWVRVQVHAQFAITSVISASAGADSDWTHPARGSLLTWPNVGRVCQWYAVGMDCAAEPRPKSTPAAADGPNIAQTSVDTSIGAHVDTTVSPVYEHAPSPDLVKAVNRNVNRRVHQSSDSATYGVSEFWSPAGESPLARGDCEDIALEKLAELIKSGVSSDHLFLATVYKPQIGLHTVLLVRLARGDVVLDNLEPRVLPWAKTHFSWLRLQAPDHPMVWHRMAAL